LKEKRREKRERKRQRDIWCNSDLAVAVGLDAGVRVGVVRTSGVARGSRESAKPFPSLPLRVL
jgi:hypothetical protein